MEELKLAHIPEDLPEPPAKPAPTSLLALYTGKLKPFQFGSQEIKCGIDKEKVPCWERLWVSKEKLENNETAAATHGGPERVLNHYPAEHYLKWIERCKTWLELPESVDLFQPPGFGENISTVGLNEHNVWYGLDGYVV